MGLRGAGMSILGGRWFGGPAARVVTVVVLGLLLAAMLPAQAVTAVGAAAPAPQRLPVSFPKPMPAPTSASARTELASGAIDPRFTRQPATGAGCPGSVAVPGGGGSALAAGTTVSREAGPAAPGGAGACISPRAAAADAGYRQAHRPGQAALPSPDWTLLHPAHAPAARFGAATVYDPASGQVVLFGGSRTEGGTLYGSTWTWDGRDWTNRTPSLAVSPPARALAQIAYDPAHRQVVLFGGASAGTGALGDTWTWDGSAWTPATPAASPPARSGGVMGWDPRLRRVVLFGGRAAGGRLLGDTWAWDGAGWRQVHPASAPPDRSGAAMALDEARGGLVLFGGMGGAGTLDDTWSFDGRSWKRLGPAARPSPRTGAGMVFDPQLGRLVLVGGAEVGPGGARRDLNDTWAWDGRAWARLAGIASPAPREEAGMAFDAASGQVLLVGGSRGAGGRPGATTLADTAALAAGAPTLTETVDKGPNGLYPSGGTAHYRLTVGNSNLLSGLAVTVQDQLPPSLALAGAPITIVDVGTGSTIACDGVLVICATSGGTLTVTGLVIGVLDSLTIGFDPVAVGLGRACSTATDKAIASSLLGSSGPVSIPITICDTGLGTESWWSFASYPVGPQAQAGVNVSNGNLVVQQTDSTPIQARGHLAYALQRTYNSQDTTLLSFPGSFGAGWNLDIAQTGDLAGLGVGATGLYVPPLHSVLDPLAVTLIDAGGTRHVFQFKGLSATIDLTGLLGQVLGGPLDELVPSVLTLDTSKFNHLCVDESFSAPAGVHLGLYRYIEVHSGNLVTPCSVPDPGTTPVVLGFATVSPTRVRDEFSFDGHLLDVRDSSGTDLRYQYAVEPLAGVALGPLQTIFEPRSCSLPLASTCRSFQFHYGTDETDVTDPAGRVTKYHFDETPLTPRLVQVDNPDGSTVKYAYQKNAFSGVDCGGSANQLCSVTDPRGDTTRFAYTPPPLIGLDKVASMTDRRGSTMTFTYSTSPDVVTVDQAGHRTRYAGIDDSGRVAEIDEGDTSGNVLHQTLNTFDTPGATCQQPDPAVNNNLCRQVLKSLTAQTPDQDSTFTYNDEGQSLVHHVASPALDTTAGYHAQYFEADGSVRTFDDTVQGSGQVSSTGQSGGRTDAATLFAVSDQTQSLTPRGNAAGSDFAPFLTTYKVDDNPAVEPNAIPPANPCANPDAPTSDTGDLCEVDAPSFDGGAHPSVTRYTYDTFGARLTMASPKAIAETPAGQAVPVTTYTYYQDSDLDLSGSVSAGGWLKGVTDPTGDFVAFAYDRAGDVARAWDRNATQGHQLADFPGSAASPPSNAFVETLYATGTGALSAPWRYLRSTRDQLGNLTTYTVDPNGNQTAIRPPRGNAAGNASFDVTQTFDQNDDLLTTLLPVEAAANKPTIRTYDAFGNQLSTTDPDGNVTTAQFDSVNRQVGTAFTRGPFPSDTSTVPSACRQSTAADAPIPAGRIVCTTATSYDGVDNELSRTDANHQVTTSAYDGAHRLVSQLVPRNDGTFTTLRTDTVYDADGNVTDVCPPRQFTEGGSTACTASGAFSQHSTYDVAGRLATDTTFRTAGGPPDTVGYAYDADGNRVSVTDANGHTTTAGYDLLDRQVSQTVPRDATSSNTTTWNHDPSGNVTAVVEPGNRITAYSYDAANRLVDTVQGADNTSAAAAGTPDVSGGSNIRTRLAYDADGNVVARFDPSAFAASTQTPDPTFMVRLNIDQDGRTTAAFQPRYDGGAHADTGLSGTQTAQCPTGAAPDAVPGVPGYPAGVGVCVTRYQYDAAGRQTRMVMPTSSGTDNRFVSYAYTDDGLVSSVDSPSPAQASGARTTSVTTLYDAVGRMVSQTDALGHQQTTTYTADGLVAQQAMQPNGSITHVTSQAYDANGDPTTSTDGLGNKATTSYFADGLRQSVADGLGETTRYVYDPAGNLTQTFSPSAVAKDATNSAGTPETATYTFDDLLLTTTSPVASDGSSLRRTTYGYDAAGRKTSQSLALVDAQGNVTSSGGGQGFGYFPDDRLSTETGRSGETITHTYDPAGNPLQVHDSTSGGSTVSATYYLDNTQRTVDDGSRTTQYAYDGAGQLAAKADAVDTSGSRAVTGYTYGDAEQLVSMSSALVGGQTSFAYDAGGRLVHETDPNGQQTTYVNNPDNTLASKSLTDPSGGSVASFTYTYDGNFQITAQTFTGEGNKQGRQSYTYDAAGHLHTFAQDSNPTQTATWDHNGNRLSLGTTGSATYNADNSLASTTDSTGTVHPNKYSSRGDLVNDGCFAYAYDGFDRITSVSPTGATGCPATPAQTYTYDGLDRQRTAGGTALHYDGSSSLVSVETNSGTDTAYELTPTGLAKAVDVQAPAVGPAQFLSDDGQGNITTITNSSGALDCSVRYDPWGSPLAAQSPSNPCDAGSTINDHFYRGQRLDPVTGTYQLGSRPYSPAKATFTSPDTYRLAPPSQDLSIDADPLTENRYSYVNGDPVNLYDPDGHCSWNPFSGSGSCYDSAAHWVNQHVVQPAANWTSQHVIQPVVNDVIKPALNWTNQNIVKPVAHALGTAAHAVAQAATAVWHNPIGRAIIVGVGVVALGAACVATVGVGCAVAAGIGAAVGAGIGAATCGSGQSLLGCVGTGALVGAVGGLAFPVAAAGAGALGAGALTATLAAGGVSGLAGGLASQTLAGHYDAGQLAFDTLTGAATAGLLKGAGSVASKVFPGLQGKGGALGRLIFGDTERPSVPFDRSAHYGGAATNGPVGRAIRTAAEGQTCIDCGQPMVTGTPTAPVPEHSPPLVQHYYEYGGWRMTPEQARAYARSADAFDGARCLTCQRKQGWQLSQYSQEMKRALGLE